MLRCIVTASVALILSPLAVAQATSDSDVIRTYTVADFERYAPRTALDMVQEIPGFSFTNDNDGSRGFGQASGNVILNGQRVSGKSNGVRDALSRIPVENVERIEIVDGATLDIPGLSGQVANVIAAANEGVSGTWEWEGRVREVVRPFLDRGEVSASGKNGNLSWTLGLESNPGRGGAVGTEEVFDGSGALVETREEKFNFIGVNPSLSGSLGWTPENGNIANLNASYTIFEANVKEVSLQTPTDGGPRVDRLFQRSEDEWNTEIGGDYEFGVGPGRLKFIGLYSYEHSPFKNRVFAAAVDASSAEETVFNQTIDEGESIARAEYSWVPSEGRDWQIAVEGAFNELESEAQFFEGFDFAPLGQNQITDPPARVEEVRGEISATHGRKITEKLTLQASLGAEISEISQAGANVSSQTFTRPKGFLSLSYNVRDGYTISSKLERRVGQLNFFDFIASSDINNGTGRDANPDLSPQQSWYAEVEAERDFGVWGAGSLKVFGEEIEDIVDRIPLRNSQNMIVGDGIGNIDSANSYGFEFSSTIKFDPMGLEGVQLETNGNYLWSSVTDPLTGEDRRFNNAHIYNWDAELRHDIPNTDWAWGVYAEEHVDGDFFLLDQVSRQIERPPFTVLFVEHKDLFGMTGSLRFGNVLGRGDRNRRLIFTPDRQGTLSSKEIREREFGDILTFGLSGSF